MNPLRKVSHSLIDLEVELYCLSQAVEELRATLEGFSEAHSGGQGLVDPGRLDTS